MSEPTDQESNMVEPDKLEKQSQSTAVSSDELAQPYLTAKQQRFVAEFLIDNNATQAAIRAGYSPGRSAEQAGYRLKKLPEVSRAIELGRQEQAERLDINAEWVLAGLKRNAELSSVRKPKLVLNRVERKMEQATDLIPCPSCGKLIEHGVFEYDSQGANRAYELIGKHIGMFVDRTMDMTAVQAVISILADAIEAGLREAGIDSVTAKRVTKGIAKHIEELMPK